MWYGLFIVFWPMKVNPGLHVEPSRIMLVKQEFRQEEANRFEK
ncbi:hypothetical protein FHT67_000165 [Paenibacillus sp. BK720]|nr:hypothetical protein [Paenibacillus sp. BK720]